MMVRKAFRLTDADLTHVRRELFTEIRRGLSLSGQTIAALPSYLSPPKCLQPGLCIAIDCGGTNLRAAMLRCDLGGKLSVVSGPVEAVLPVGQRDNSARAFFDAHVNLIMQLNPPSGLGLAYSFSYPSENNRAGDARLLKWTKGLTFEDIEGSLVGASLAEALAVRGIRIDRFCVLNDAVATLFAAPFHERGTSIGLIVGTGFNLATYVRGGQISKCTDWPLEKIMAVNLETGNFSPPGLTAIDRQVDQASGNPAEQGFEKAVSGLYLPALFNMLCPDGKTDLAALNDAKTLVALRNEAPDTESGKWAAAILNRSADYVSAGLAAVVDISRARAGEGKTEIWPVEIMAEGGLFWGDARYERRVLARLEASLGEGYSVNIRRTEDANLIGTARALFARGT
jgi:hexokinase